MKIRKLIPPVLLLALGGCAYWLYFVKDATDAPPPDPAIARAEAELSKQGISSEEYAKNLLTGAQVGNTDTVRLLLTAGADPAARDNALNTALHSAAGSGFADICRLLAEKGCPIDAANSGGQSALHVAAKRGQAACVAVLLELGAEMNRPDADGYTPMLYAVKERHSECLRLLLEAGADPRMRTIEGKTIYDLASADAACSALLEGTKTKPESPGTLAINTTGKTSKLLPTEALTSTSLMVAAIKEDNATELSALLQNGADPNTTDRESGAPLIIIAIEHGALKCLGTLMEHGADTNRAANDGTLPLHYAASAGNVEVIRLLLANKAQVKARANGVSALIKAIDAGHTDCVEALLQAGADANEQTSPGYTPLYRAAEQGHTDCMRLLLRHGAAVNALSNRHTALFAAASAGLEEGVSLLLEAGADPDICETADNHTALFKATEKGHASCVTLLLQAGANPNGRDARGFTPLHLAAQQGNSDCLLVLVQNGANPALLSSQKLTALHTAAAGGHADCIAALIGTGMDPNFAEGCERGLTPLHAAVQQDSRTGTEALLQAGANPLAADAAGETPLAAARKGVRRNSLQAIALHLLAQQGINTVDATVLLHAAQSGNVEQLQLMIEADSSLLLSGNTGAHALIAAAGGGHSACVELLLRNGVSADSTAENKNTPLHAAAGAGQAECVALLLRHGADFTRTDNHGKTPLNLASAAKHDAAARKLAIAENLLKKGFKPADYSEALHTVAVAGEHGTLSLLLEAGADVNHADKNGLTALHKAAETRYVTCVKKLLEAGADPNRISDTDTTPLIVAAAAGHSDNLRALLAAGAKAELSTKSDTAATAAIKHEKEECLLILLESGVSANAVDDRERPLLYWAIFVKNNDLMRILLERGANVNAKINTTPLLHATIELGNADAVVMMLETGKLDIHARDDSGRYAIHMSAITGNIKLMALLIKAGINTSVTDHAGMTIQHHAAASGHREMLRQLMQITTDVNRTDSRGLTPLDHAAKAGHTSCVEFLKSVGGKSARDKEEGAPQL